MVVRIRIDSKDVQKSLMNAPKKLRALAQKKMRPITKSLTKQAKATAPQKTGRLKRAIYGRTFKNPIRAEVGIPNWVNSSGTGFYYPAFVTGKVAIRIDKPNKFFKVGQTVNYGMTAISPSGNSIVWSTPDPRWWFRIESRASKEYPKAMKEAVQEFTKEF